MWKPYQNTRFLQLDPDISTSAVAVIIAGIIPMTNPGPIPPPIPIFLRAQGFNEAGAAPLMLGVQTISGCRRLVHATSRKGWPGNQSQETRVAMQGYRFEVESVLSQG